MQAQAQHSHNIDETIAQAIANTFGTVAIAKRPEMVPMEPQNWFAFSNMPRPHQATLQNMPPTTEGLVNSSTLQTFVAPGVPGALGAWSLTCLLYPIVINWGSIVHATFLRV